MEHSQIMRYGMLLMMMARPVIRFRDDGREFQRFRQFIDVRESGRLPLESIAWDVGNQFLNGEKYKDSGLYCFKPWDLMFGPKVVREDLVLDQVAVWYPANAAVRDDPLFQFREDGRYLEVSLFTEVKF